MNQSSPADVIIIANSENPTPKVLIHTDKAAILMADTVPLIINDQEKHHVKALLSCPTFSLARCVAGHHSGYQPAGHRGSRYRNELSAR